jgi:hypothetical protein
MSTNFSWMPKPLREGADAEEEGAIHIGKFSHGHPFLLMIHPRRKIRTLGDWLEKVKAGYVYDECNRPVTRDYLIERMKVAEECWRESYANDWRDLPSRNNGEEVVFEMDIAHTLQKREFC